MVELALVETDAAFVGISAETARALDVSDGQILLLTGVSGGPDRPGGSIERASMGRARISPEARDDSVEANASLIRALGSGPGHTVEVTPFRGEPVPVDGVHFEIEVPADGPTGTEALKSFVENEDRFVAALRGKPFTTGSKFAWGEQGVAVKIGNTTPTIGADDVAYFDRLRNFSCGVAGADPQGFDAILLPDMSTSMDVPDMFCEDTQWAISILNDELAGGLPAGLGEQFPEGARIGRRGGALLCTLLYLAGLAGKTVGGNGTNLAVIPFGGADDTAGAVGLGGSPFYSAINERSPTADRAAGAIAGMMGGMQPGPSILAPALEAAAELSKSMDWRRVKMIVLITGGRLDDEERAMRVIEERMAPRSDIVLNVLGIGTGVNSAPLIRMAGMTGGTYRRVYGMRDLETIFGRYAREISARGIGAEALKAGCGVAPTTCPGCADKMEFIEVYSSWFCRTCGKYRQDFQVDAALADPETPCPGCKRPTFFVPEGNGHFCFACQSYI